ncbi:MAG: hypothetical protein IT374_25345 [Polyangiaceae bacterium]|nr:hypothetical protein [Polyangiaceae bacterium]
MTSTSAAAAPAWQTFPTGRPFVGELARPAAGAFKVCGFRQPVCVHARRGAEAAALSTLAIAEEAEGALLAQAGLPRPLPDGAQGGSPELDLYLARRPQPLGLGQDLPTRHPVDRASVFAVLDERASGCAARLAVYRAVAAASLSAVDAGAEAYLFAGFGGYLAATLSGCPRELEDAVDRAQRAPEASLFTARALDDGAASPILPLYLEGGFASGAPGALLAAMAYGGEQSTPIDATRYRNRPDLFEVLRRVARSRDKRVDEALLDLAVARAFLGDRDDGRHVGETSRFGAFGRARFDGDFPLASLPRRVAFTPLMPTGSTYFWIDLAGAPEGVRVALRLEWEQPSTLRWAAVRVGQRGEELSRVEITTPQATEAVEREVSVLDGAAGLLVVGVNVGEVGPGHPYRVDEQPSEPRGGTLYAFVPE